MYIFSFKRYLAISINTANYPPYFVFRLLKVNNVRRLFGMQNTDGGFGRNGMDSPLPDRISQLCDIMHEQQFDFKNKINCI